MSDTQCVGDFDAGVRDQLNGVQLVLTEVMSLEWRQCELLADFLSNYFAVFFPEEGSDSEFDRKDMTHSIGYMLNELVENSVKFRAKGDIELAAGLVDDHFSFVVTNIAESHTIPPFVERLEELVAGDPGELLVQKMEANFEAGNEKASGLGFLTLMSDYGARLGWEMKPIDDGFTRVSTMGRLAAKKGN